MGGNNEEVKPSENLPSLANDQTNIHVYPDWAAMQAYYGARVALPQYYNPSVPAGHAPHPYMWAPQSMIPPFAAPYATLYSHGGIYTHTMGPFVEPHMNAETPKKAPGNAERGLMKKLKKFDGLAMSIGSGNANSSPDNGSDRGLSPSRETEGSSDASDLNTGTADRIGSKTSPEEGTPTDAEGNTENAVMPMEIFTASDNKGLSATAVPCKAAARSPTLPSPTIPEPRSAPAALPLGAPQSLVPFPSESWFQDEREIKRERRKQSNRESARRSRLRKQAESEELALKVENLSAENVTLKSEIGRLNERSEKLRLENATLMQQHMKFPEAGRKKTGGVESEDRNGVVGTENLLSKVDTCSSAEDEDEAAAVAPKLRQMMSTSPRTDALAASS